MNLNGKNVLLLAPNFFEYKQNIHSELVALGANVVSFNERISDKPIIKAIIRMRLHFLISPLINNYYKKILNEIENINLDFIFVINPEVINKSIFDSLCNNNPGIRTILYLWDSINNKPHFEKLFCLFDEMWSFDRSDCKKNENLKFLPLFFDISYIQVAKANTELEYDFCFIGTVHSDRFAIVNSIKLQAKDLGLKVYTFMYLPSKLMFFYKKFFDKGFLGIRYSDLAYTPLSENEIINILAKSKIVIDINHNLQNGLTSRTFETLAANKKLLTTNSSITDYDFYDKNNIDIIDRNNPKLSVDFLSSEYNHNMSKLISNYSIKNWVIEIFRINN